MQHTSACLLVCLALSACKTEDRPPRSESKVEAQAPAATPASPAQPTAPAPAAPAAAQTPPAPEPTTPAEMETARKAAMMEGRDLDVIKYCEMLGIQAGKGDPQAQLGCAMAACRADQADKARAWAKALPKLLKEQANKTCLANHVVL
jgi:hypothetical protein